jgi:hypothetical protein
VQKSMTDRRSFPRFQLEPMYTPLAMSPGGDVPFENEGHAYDISEGGVRFEAESPVAPGTCVQMRITLPIITDHELETNRTVLVTANVVWLEDEDEPGPYKMAAVFTHFARAGDRERLLRQFASGRYRAAA